MIRIPTDAYPLTWPEGFDRTPDGERKSANFGKKGERWGVKRLTVSQALGRLMIEVDRFTKAGQGWRIHPEEVIVSTDIQVMRQHDTPATLHYVDPPYLPETRSMNGHRYYRHEMDEQGHVELLDALKALKGNVVLSGYESSLYNGLLTGWRRVTLATTGSSRFGSVKRTECLWLSPGVSP